MSTFCFLLRQAADRQVLSKAKPPTVRTSKRYAIKITPHSAGVPLSSPTSTLYCCCRCRCCCYCCCCSFPTLLPPRLLVRSTSHHGRS